MHTINGRVVSKTSVTNNAYDIKIVAIEDDTACAYLDWAMGVIASGALPEVLDGLQLVHRCILFSMTGVCNDCSRPCHKFARAGGYVMGNYSPHGELAMYGAVMRLTQDVNLRVTMVDCPGNVLRRAATSASASRHTGAILSNAAHTLIEYLDRETVDVPSNYDDTLHGAERQLGAFSRQVGQRHQRYFGGYGNTSSNTQSWQLDRHLQCHGRAWQSPWGTPFPHAD